jgi:hypothetical protein
MEHHEISQKQGTVKNKMIVLRCVQFYVVHKYYYFKSNQYFVVFKEIGRGHRR